MPPLSAQELRVAIAHEQVDPLGGSYVGSSPDQRLTASRVAGPVSSIPIGCSTDEEW